MAKTTAPAPDLCEHRVPKTAYCRRCEEPVSVGAAASVPPRPVAAPRALATLTAKRRERYMAAADRAGKTLTDWILDILDEEAKQ